MTWPALRLAVGLALTLWLAIADVRASLRRAVYVARHGAQRCC